MVDCEVETRSNLMTNIVMIRMTYNSIKLLAVDVMYGMPVVVLVWASYETTLAFLMNTGS